MNGWGPDACRGAVTLCFEHLAGGLQPAVVSPALPALLEALGERDLPATFFVEAEAVEREPLALTLITNAGNEVGALVEPGDQRSRVLEALAGAHREPRGVSAWEVDDPLLAELSARPSVRYIAGPVSDIALVAGLVRIPVDRAISAAAFLGDSSDNVASPAARGPQDWHAAMQLAVARAVERGDQVTLTFTPGLLERGDAFGVFAETLDLVGGLRRAGRLWVPSLDGLASWWLESAQR